MSGERIVALAYEAFEAWVRTQSDEVQALDLLEQIELYAASNDNDNLKESAR